MGYPHTDLGSTSQYGQYGYLMCPRLLPWYQGWVEPVEMPSLAPGLWHTGRASMPVHQAPRHSGPITEWTSRLFTKLVHRTPPRPSMPVPRFSGNSDFTAFHQRFELAVRMNSWTYVEAAKNLACSVPGEAENCLNEVSCAEDLDDYKLLL